MEGWESTDPTLGWVYKSSGIRVRKGPVGQRYRMDWVLIRLERSNRLTNKEVIVNEVCMIPSMCSPVWMLNTSRYTNTWR